MKTGKWLAWVMCLLSGMIALILPMNAKAAVLEHNTEKYPIQSFCDSDGVVQIIILDDAVIEPYFTEKGVEYYAYLDLNEAEEELIPVILAARNRIIFENSWVTDETNGRVLDENGNVLEVLPHFHEIFPEDWEVPCFPPEYNAG